MSEDQGREIIDQPPKLPPRPRPSNKPVKVTRYRKIAWPGHPLAHADGQVYEHRVVLYNKIGPGSHVCHWCGVAVAWGNTLSDLLVDHLNQDRYDNDPDNLVPACFSCNVGRAKRARTHCKMGHEYTQENTYIRGSGSRQCRICKAEALERHYRRKRGLGT
jgi:hypothetical protein